MTTTTATPPAEFCHLDLANGVEFAAELLPQRQTVAICCRLLTGLADEPPELTGINGIVERTLSKGTRRFGRVRCPGGLVVVCERAPIHARASRLPAGVHACGA